MDKKTLTKYIIIAIVVLIIFYEVKGSITSTFSSEKERKEAEDAINAIKVKTNNLSYSPDVYSYMAVQLKESIGYFISPNQSQLIITVFDMVKNIDDLLALIKAYGYNDGHTLSGDINKFLGTWSLLGYVTIPQINEILKNKNINFKF